MRTPERAFDRKIRKSAGGIAEAILGLDSDASCSAVVDIWRARKEPSDLLSYVYDELNIRYTRYPGSNWWHPRLRSTRNHPEHGPALFAAIRKEKA